MTKKYFTRNDSWKLLFLIWLVTLIGRAIYMIVEGEKLLILNDPTITTNGVVLMLGAYMWASMSRALLASRWLFGCWIASCFMAIIWMASVSNIVNLRINTFLFTSSSFIFVFGGIYLLRELSITDIFKSLNITERG